MSFRTPLPPVPERFIDPKTNRPYVPRANALFPPKLLKGAEWRQIYPQYVDANGLLTTLVGDALDEAIKNKTVISGNEWRELNKDRQVKYENATKVRDFYIDSLTLLPPIDPHTGELLKITEAIASVKIDTGEWITIKQYIQKSGYIEFVNIKTKEPVELTGSALFAAIKNNQVHGRVAKYVRGTRLKNSRDEFSASPVGILLSQVERELEEREGRRKKQCTPTRPERPPLPSPNLSFFPKPTPPSTPSTPSLHSSSEVSEDDALGALKSFLGLDVKGSGDKIELLDFNLDQGPSP